MSVKDLEQNENLPLHPLRPSTPASDTTVQLPCMRQTGNWSVSAGSRRRGSARLSSVAATWASDAARRATRTVTRPRRSDSPRCAATSAWHHSPAAAASAGFAAARSTCKSAWSAAAQSTGAGPDSGRAATARRLPASGAAPIATSPGRTRAAPADSSTIHRAANCARSNSGAASSNAARTRAADPTAPGDSQPALRSTRGHTADPTAPPGPPNSFAAAVGTTSASQTGAQTSASHCPAQGQRPRRTAAVAQVRTNHREAEGT
jgi:hypothetical protein